MTQDDPLGTTRSGSGRYSDCTSLAGEVISILTERQTVGPAGARQIVVDYLVRAITRRTDFDAQLVMEEMGAYRVTHDALIDLYIPQAAELLGSLWKTSDLDFASVTIGSLRLQALLGEAAHGLTRHDVDSEGVLHALVIVPEAEQHFLGASVVAAQLRRLGCDVSLSINETRQQIVGRVLYDRPDMVLFSCARAAALETVQRTVTTIKQSVDRVPVLAIGGGVCRKSDKIREQTGVDLVTNTAKDVVGFATKRTKALGRQ
ncbi:MAG: cobalamin B12-binding domain-containing protein [Pseudomonadota bacterium]